MAPADSPVRSGHRRAEEGAAQCDPHPLTVEDGGPAIKLGEVAGLDPPLRAEEGLLRQSANLSGGHQDQRDRAVAELERYLVLYRDRFRTFDSMLSEIQSSVEHSTGNRIKVYNSQPHDPHGRPDDPMDVSSLGKGKKGKGKKGSDGKGKGDKTKS